MKYYKFEYNSLNEKETGTQFQCADGYIGDMQRNIFPMEGKIEFEFELPIPYMDKKAKSTTLLNFIPISYDFMVLKNYFIDFIKNYNIGEFQEWSIKVTHNKTYYQDYSLFILNYPKQREIVDFRNSSFYLGRYSDYKFIGQNICVDSYDNYLSILEVLGENEDNFLKCSKIKLDLSKVDLDLLRLSNTPLAGGYYVSERLKKEIEKQRFTGFKFVAIEEMDSRIQVKY
ncbi:MAG TPA: hypothetical protein VFD80_06725 [Flavobacteriaceae bacterium]|nr:hypothetical protein [Flavobacteriaceae bacterium]